MRQLLRSRLPQHLAKLMRCRRAGCLREAWAPAGDCHSLLRRRWRSGRAAPAQAQSPMRAALPARWAKLASQLLHPVARLPNAPCKCVCPGAACGLPHVNGRVVRRGGIAAAKGAFLPRPFTGLPHVHAMQHLAADTLLRRRLPAALFNACATRVRLLGGAAPLSWSTTCRRLRRGIVLSSDLLLCLQFMGLPRWGGGHEQ